jgi:hypothetical protein
MSTRRGASTQVARSTPFDNSTNEFEATNVQDAIEEIGVSASPGFGFGRSGNVTSGTWLLRTGSVPSNKTGVTMGINNPKLKQIDIGNEDISTFDIGIYEHEGNEINLTLLATVSVVSARTGSFTVLDFGEVIATQGRQLAVRITAGSAKNLGVDVTLIGQS